VYRVSKELAPHIIDRQKVKRKQQNSIFIPLGSSYNFCCCFQNKLSRAKARGSQLKKIFVLPHIFNEKYPIRGIGKTKKYILNMKKI
jgi:hypothetical protein